MIGLPTKITKLKIFSSSIENNYNLQLKIWKANDFLNLINHKLNTCNRYPYTKDLYKRNNQLLSNHREKVLEEYLKDPKAFIQYSNNMKDVYSNSDEWWWGLSNTMVVFHEIIDYY